MTFKRFVLSVLPNELWERKFWFVRPQYDFIFSEDGVQLVDFIGRFESLHSDFQTVCKRVGMVGQLQHVNRTKAKRRATVRGVITRVYRHGITAALHAIEPRAYFADYRDYYCAETQRAVQMLYAKDVEAFNYGFESR